jgi:hypothetical protein
MGKRNLKEVAKVSEIPHEAIGAVVAADLCQIEADAKTHPDKDAQERILFAVNRLREIAHGELSAELVAAIPQIQAIFEVRADG